MREGCSTGYVRGLEDSLSVRGFEERLGDTGCEDRLGERVRGQAR